MIVGKNNTNKNNLPHLLFCALLVASSIFCSIVVHGQDDFTAITGDIDQSVTGVTIDPGCNSDGSDTPNAMFTVEVSDDDAGVTVSTTPPNLVTAVVDGTTLSFQWTTDSETLSQVKGGSSGVKIGFPASQLTTITVKLQETLQVTDGFTSVTDLSFDGQSTTRATFSSLTEGTTLSVNANGQATADVKSNVNVQATSNGQSTLNVETPSCEQVNVNGQSSMSVSGDVGGGSVDGQASLTASGSVTDGTTLSANGQSSVTISSCDNVSTGGQASCNSGDIDVSVDVSEQSSTMKGTRGCTNFISFNVCIGGNNHLWSCDRNEVVLARNVQIGDSIRTRQRSGSNDECSDVYYVFRHKEDTNPAIRFHVRSISGITSAINNSNNINDNSNSNVSSFDVSYNHILYVGESFENRRPVLSQDVKSGDKLVTSGSSTSSSSFVEVVSVEGTDVDLVNVLTVDPHLELQLFDNDDNNSNNNNNNVVISAFSHDEDMYGMLFAPVKYIYLTLGATAVEMMKPLFDVIDSTVSSYFKGQQGTTTTTSNSVRGIIAINNNNKMTN
jgi:hypothetical protein